VFGTRGVAGSVDGGGGGGGTVGRATVFRCVGPGSRNEMIGLERTVDGLEGDGDIGLANGRASHGLPVDEMLGDMSLSAVVDDCSRFEKKSSDPEP